jgi:hypothetical protein
MFAGGTRSAKHSEQWELEEVCDLRGQGSELSPGGGAFAMLMIAGGSMVTGCG